jgi:hypothetical protein
MMDIFVFRETLTFFDSLWGTLTQFIILEGNINNKTII